MLKLFLSEKGSNVITCPLCERELIPAYRGPEGLEVGYWHDFDPGEVRTGLMVCGDFNCEYEEPAEFATEREDAVPVSLRQTLSQFEEENNSLMPIAVARDIAAQLERVYSNTRREKLRSAIEYYRMIIDDREERISSWIEAAGTELVVEFRCEEGDKKGRMRSYDEEHIVLELETGSQETIRRDDITWERIIYPSKPTRSRKDGEGFFILCLNHQFVVVQGYHLEYSGPRGRNRFTAYVREQKAAEALHMERIGENVWQGIFSLDEVERCYWRRSRVKIQGHWFEELGGDGHGIIRVETKDPELAKLLDLEPSYALVYLEFGCSEGEVVSYGGYFPETAIEDRIWYEVPMELEDDEFEEWFDGSNV